MPIEEDVNPQIGDIWTLIIAGDCEGAIPLPNFICAGEPISGFTATALREAIEFSFFLQVAFDLESVTFPVVNGSAAIAITYKRVALFDTAGLSIGATVIISVLGGALGFAILTVSLTKGTFSAGFSLGAVAIVAIIVALVLFLPALTGGKGIGSFFGGSES